MPETSPPSKSIPIIRIGSIATRKLVAEAANRPIFMVDWRQRNATFFNALQVERNVMFLILTIIVIVAAFNITSGLIMLVKDKGRDIGILRTMGATQGAIMRVFMMTGASVGVVGTFVGFLLALLVCLNIESIRRFVSWLTNTEVFSPELYFLSKFLPIWMPVRRLRLSSWRSRYRCWRRSIQPGARRVSIRSRRCAMNDAIVNKEKSGRTGCGNPRNRRPSCSSTPSTATTAKATSLCIFLSGAELAVWPGQSVALVAPSGAGKSTLLHIAGLLEHPDRRGCLC